MTTDKRFDLVCDNNVEWLMQEELFLPIIDKNTNKKITLKQCYDLLNSLAQEEQLKWSDEISYLEIMIKKLKEKNKELEELVDEVDNELEIRDIICRAGKFRLEEWGKHRYHQFYKDDEKLEDEAVVIMLMELEKENKELQERNNRQAKQLDELYHLIKDKDWRTLTDIVDDFKKAEEQLQKEWGTYSDLE